MKLFWFLSSDVDQFQSRETRQLTNRPRWILWITLFSLITFLVWAEWAEIDQITRAPGSVIASSKTQVLQSKDGGVIVQLVVKEGDRVQQGDPLVYMDNTQAESSFLETEAKVAGLQAVVSRLKAEVLGQQPNFPALLNSYPQFVKSQLDLFKKRQSALEAELVSLEEIKQLVIEELQLYKPLMETGDVSKTEILRCRVRYFSDGKILGSAEFVREVSSRLLSPHDYKYPKQPKRLIGADWGDLSVFGSMRARLFG